MTRSSLRRRAIPAALACIALTIVSACGGQDAGSGGSGQNAGGGDSSLSGPIRVDGSSTVAPLSQAAAELFAQQYPGTRPTVATSGTGGGFEKFCVGDTDISDASRPIDEEEAAKCEKNGIEYVELTVGLDAISVVVNPENTWVKCLTTEQLQKMWEPAAEGTITNWNQIDPSFPDKPLVLFGPGTDSGTFDYFTKVINGEAGISRSDYQASEDDNVLAQGVKGNPNALAYFGFSYLRENRDGLKVVGIDSGEGCVKPSVETAKSGEYEPLTRPLYIYVSKKAYQTKPQVETFVKFYLKNIQKIGEAAKIIPIGDKTQQKMLSSVEAKLEKQ